MMTVRTKAGHDFDCDMVAENPSPPRLYLNLVGATMADVATYISDADGLPVTVIDGDMKKKYSAYTEFLNLVKGQDAIRVTLKKKGG